MAKEPECEAHGIAVYSASSLGLPSRKRSICDERALQELETILSIHDVRNIQEDKHMPLYCIDVLRNYIREAYASGKISRMDVRPFCIIHRNDYFIP
jgi:hypothetical protein